MPDTPAVSEQFESGVAVVDVPMNQGEKERFGAALNLEDRRRRESMLAEQLKGMAGTSSGEMASRFARSPSARKRQQAIIRKTQELKNLTRKYGDVWEGPCAPFTIINLNPIPLRLSGQLQSYSLSKAGEGNRAEVPFRGRKFVGSYMTISTPEVWLAHTGIELDPIADTPQMEARYIAPIGLAHQFYSHYSEGASDAQHIGGILTFEGDIHTAASGRLNKNQRRIRVPEASPSPDVPGEVLYSTVERDWDDYLATELDRQRNYAEAMIAQGHSYSISQSDIIRNQLGSGHVTWHNYAFECGYIKQAYPWASSVLKDGPLTQAVFCPDCRSRQEDPQQYFCRHCNAPFDAHKAFMAGKQVSPDRLAVYEEDSAEFKEILAELNRRRRRMALLEPPEPKKSKKAEKEN